MRRKRDNTPKRLGPAATAMRRNYVFRDARQAGPQITTEQLIQDAVAMQRFYSPGGGSGSAARLTIYSKEELALYRQKSRAELEERVKRGHTFLGNWIKYARWEAQQKDFERMRAVLQRAIPVQGENPSFWRDYAELEAANGFVQQAREVYHRAVSVLPLCVDLWLKYLIFEQVAGQGENARDVFSRWISGESPPDCSYELYALFEAQRGRREACRDVLRQYVEARNTPEAWLFIGQVEQHVFGDDHRAIKTLQTALEALPDEYLWGPTECRVPLALAEFMVAKGCIQEARSMYHTLLHHLRCKDQEGDHAGSLAELALSAYSSFERLHGDRQNCEALFCIAAKHLYERRLRNDPEDFDARLSLYLLLREDERKAALQQSREAVGCSVLTQSSLGASIAAMPPVEVALSPPKADAQALRCLTGSLCTPATRPDRSQQRAVLVMEYARRAEEEGQIDAARQALGKEIKEFPFDEANCTRLWLEAAAFEERQGDFDSARRLLSAAACVSFDPSIFSFLLQMERRALEKGAVASYAEYLARARRIYRDALRAFPAHEALWFSFARMEEKEGQLAKAHALYSACARMLTAEAAKTRSYAQRYALLGRADRSWAHRIALQTRLIKRLQRSSMLEEQPSRPSSEIVGFDEQLRKANDDLHDIYLGLLHCVWEDYVHEAVVWKSKYEQEYLGEKGEADPGIMKTDCGAPSESPGVLVPPPPSLSDTLGPAKARWSDAVAAVKSFLLCRERHSAPSVSQAERSSDAPEGHVSQDNSRILPVRNLFKSMIATQRDVMRRALGFTELIGFDASEILNRWVELLLSPLLHEWSSFEVLEGGSLEAFKEHVNEPAKRRRRLFKK